MNIKLPELGEGIETVEVTDVLISKESIGADLDQSFFCFLSNKWGVVLE